MFGERGIRTPVTVSREPDFESGTFSHSAISPQSVYNSKNSTIPEKLTSQPPGPPEHIPCSTDSLKQLLSLMNLKRTTPNDTPRKYFSQALL
jgi:hypothetical protein